MAVNSLRRRTVLFKSVPQRGLSHVKLYPAQLKGRGGEMMVRGLVEQLQQKSVKRLGRIFDDRFAQAGRTCGRRRGL